MSCYHPLRAFRVPGGVVFSELARHDILGRIDLPCGQCIGCRMRRASDWELRVMHEASLHKDNCFVTLTYARGNLPANSSLEHRDFQLFMKRMRKDVPERVRFYMCGEYGPENQRPHYHACLFGVGFRSDRVPSGKSGSGALFYNSAQLEKLWNLGRVSVQDLTQETASYCARYIMKKALGEGSEKAYESVNQVTGEIVSRRPEYAAMSLRPGIGHDWFARYSRDVYPSDHVVQRGVTRRVPKYYDKLLRRSGAVVADQIEYERQLAAREAFSEQSEDRLAVREQVHEAKVSTLNRSLE